jgi:hypothetical protein
MNTSTGVLHKFWKLRNRGLLGCDAVSLGWWLLKFWCNYSPAKCQEPCTQCQHHILKDLKHYQHCCKNLKSHHLYKGLLSKTELRAYNFLIVWDACTQQFTRIDSNHGALFTCWIFSYSFSQTRGNWLSQTLHACLDPFIQYFKKLCRYLR